MVSKTNPLAILLPPGTIVEGRFLFETLSLGRYSTVFKVEDKFNNSQKYCIKVLKKISSSLVNFTKKMKFKM